MLGFLPVLALEAASCSITAQARINEIYSEVLDRRHNHYELKDGDSVVVRLYNRQGDLNQTGITVLPDGKSDMFFMNSHQFAGKTVAEVESELKGRLASEIKDTEMSIQVVPKGEKVIMVGEFERPGMIELTTKMTLHEAVSMAGGMKVTADTDYALLRRPFMDPRHPDSYRIDLNEDMEELFLLPGDQIVLGRTWLGSVVAYLQAYIFAIFGQPSSAVYQYAAYGAAI
jgi:protein involved in polysaccharide export with SLBB domain